MTKRDSFTPTRFELTRHSGAFWRVTFDNGPLNLIDAVMNVELHRLIDEIEDDGQVAVVLFDSANHEYFLAHYEAGSDMSPLDALEPSAASPWLHWASLLIRLSKSPAVTITALRGRARGAGSEFALATDIRFASRERAVLGQFEVAVAAIPGGGPSTRLPGIVGRGRAFEILLGGEDFDGELAERYGYVNRAVPDTEFVKFVDAFAARVSRFDVRTLAEIKGFVNAASLPDDVALKAEMRAFIEAVDREPATTLIGKGLKAGWGQPGEFELNLGSQLAKVTGAR
ncbi:enoyl-CoA hydratase/isomerase family protein [Streptomyces sp. SID1121]|uniref:enoyl-CoA hydratase/isomerase family protein n=1 Tax=Streptomyces sp. SID1121 TaxID=3425888 RepID=UPI004057C675